MFLLQPLILAKNVDDYLTKAESETGYDYGFMFSMFDGLNKPCEKKYDSFLLRKRRKE
jgi:hypothetical protein